MTLSSPHMKAVLLILSSIIFALPLSAQEREFDVPEMLQHERKHIEEIDQLLVDTSAMEQLRSRAADIVDDSLRSYVKLSKIGIDSTLRDRITAAGYAKGREVIAAETKLGKEIPEMEVDSSFASSFLRQAEQNVEGMLRNTDEFKALDISGDSELAEIKEYKKTVERAAEEARQAAVTKKLKQKMVAHGKKYIMEHAEKIQQVQSKMTKVKEKYSSVMDSKDMSTAMKRTSLKGAPLTKRLVLGGNFNVGKLNPVTIDLSPVLGYKFNKRFESGITGVYRAQVQGHRNNINAADNKVYGYSVFVSHMLFRNFFGYLEGERMNTVKQETEVHTSEWDQSLLIGIGRKVKVARWLELQGLVLFNALHDNQDGMYNNPVVFKTAVRFRK